jgi:hypothetical protein
MNRKEEALEILAALRGDGDINHPEVQREYNDIIEAIEIEHEGEIGYLEMFKKDPLNIARRVHLSVWLQIIQELTGIGVVTVYAPQCFQKAGFSSQTSQLIAGINNITYMLSTVVAILTLDRFGRRFSLFWGAAAQGLSLVLLAVMVHPSMLEKNHSVSLIYQPNIHHVSITDNLVGFWYCRNCLHLLVHCFLWHDMVNCSMALPC